MRKIWILLGIFSIAYFSTAFTTESPLTPQAPGKIFQRYQIEAIYLPGRVPFPIPVIFGIALIAILSYMRREILVEQRRRAT